MLTENDDWDRILTTFENETTSIIDNYRRNGMTGQESNWFLMASVLGGLVAVVCLYCLVRDYIASKCGLEFCYSQSRDERDRMIQMLQDENYANQMRLRLAEEERQQAMMKKRKERREKYQTFLKPYSMIVKPEDFCRDDNQKDVSSEFSVGQQQQPFSSPRRPSRKVAPLSAENSTVDLESGGNNTESASTNDNKQDPTVKNAPAVKTCDTNCWRDIVLKLPVNNKSGQPQCVEATCSICLLEYEPGDRVVWSTNKECNHAFHDECVLMWLSKGKKRCPICRNFFVPGSKSADDKKKGILEEDNLDPTRINPFPQDNDAIVTNASNNNDNEADDTGTFTFIDIEPQDEEQGMSQDQPIPSSVTVVDDDEDNDEENVNTNDIESELRSISSESALRILQRRSSGALDGITMPVVGEHSSHNVQRTRSRNLLSEYSNHSLQRTRSKDILNREVVMT